MKVLPIETVDHSTDALILILDKTSIDRMATADPAQIDLKKLGCHLVNPIVFVCHEEDSPKLNALLTGGDLKAICEYLTRGFHYRPDLGDSDDGAKLLFSSRIGKAKKD
jgi:hypothetical protein